MITHVAIKYNNRTYSLPKPNRHHNVIHLIYQENNEGINGPDTQGFLDNYGNFLTRKEAMQHAIKHNQLIRPNDPKLQQTKELYSEDLW